MINFDRERYYNTKILNIYNYLDEKDLALLNKLGVNIKDNICTEYQYDIIKQKLAEYYNDNVDESPEGKAELKKYLKSLEDVGVTQEEYDNLIKKFDEIDKIIFGE